MLRTTRNVLLTVAVTKTVNVSATLALNKLALGFVVDVTKVSFGTEIHAYIHVE